MTDAELPRLQGSDAVQEAARKILLGDTSINAANALESVLLDERLHEEEEDEEKEELLFVLALYSPRAGYPYADEGQLRAAIVSFLGVSQDE